MRTVIALPSSFRLNGLFQSVLHRHGQLAQEVEQRGEFLCIQGACLLADAQPDEAQQLEERQDMGERVVVAPAHLRNGLGAQAGVVTDGSVERAIKMDF